ncbi:hypothetical protein RJT34_22846 [Clitoria ternatea]|uniref:Uncharacterized protein n=1 Tax=Clitoria ternatea TaxID=43366 RepID=A0AAN9FK32_CLITE
MLPNEYNSLSHFTKLHWKLTIHLKGTSAFMGKWRDNILMEKWVFSFHDDTLKWSIGERDAIKLNKQDSYNHMVLSCPGRVA